MSYPTLAEVKANIGIDDSAADGQLTSYLSAAIEYAESLTGREFVAEARAESIPMIEGVYVSRDRSQLYLSEFAAFTGLRWGVAAPYEDISLAKVYAVGVGLGAPFMGIKILPDAGIAFRNAQYQQIEVTASWGYSLACPADVKQAIIWIVDGSYRRSLSRVTGARVNRAEVRVEAAQAIPDDALEILKQYKRFR